MRKRIETGTIGVPDMLLEPEVRTVPGYDDTTNALVLDSIEEEIIRSRERPWSDLEKCIFLDKFLQYPKNFGKIATFLQFKDAKDCVRFYYDSKKDLDYKALLREHQQRRRGLKLSWTETTAAVESFTCAMAYDEEDQELSFAL